MVDVLLCGACGKMGRTIFECSKKHNDINIVAGVDLVGESYDSFPIYKKLSDVDEKVDVIIDFSNPALLDDILTYAVKNNIALVAATTGYSDEQIEKIKNTSTRIPVFFTFNLSLGVNLLIDLAKRATKLLAGQFDIEIIEKHHNNKIDAPSGTAVMIANALNDVNNEKYEYVYDRHSKRQKRGENEIGISSIRGGTIVGEHEVLFAGRDEFFTIKHQATSKEVFAVGALNAAKFVANKKAGLYDMEKLLSE